MKKILAMLLVVSLSTTILSACGGSAGTSSEAATETEESASVAEESSKETAAESGAEAVATDGFKVGVSFGTMQQEHWARQRDIIQEVVEEAGGEMVFQSAEDNMQNQINQCENMITQGIDVLIVVPFDSYSLGPVVDACHEAGVKVITYIRDAYNCEPDYYCASSGYEMGLTYMEYALDVCQSGNWVIINGDPQDGGTALVHQAFMDKLQPYIDSGDITIVADQWCANWSATEAQRYIEDAMTSTNNDIQFMLTANDAFAGAALTVLEEAGLAGQVPTTGCDCDLIACQRIVAGTQGETSYMAWPYFARYCAEAAVKIATTGNADDMVNGTNNNGVAEIPWLDCSEYIYCITKENMAPVWESGWHTVAEIYDGVPQEEWPEDALAWYNEHEA